MRHLAPRLVLLAVAVLLGATAPLPRGVGIAGGSGGPCCSAESGVESPAGGAGFGCEGCTMLTVCAADASGGDAPAPCTSCVSCVCGIGVLAAPTSLELPQARPREFLPAAPIWASVVLPLASPPPELAPFPS